MYRLIRKNDGLQKKSKEIIWIEWNEDGRFKARHNEPAVGRSLIMSPFNEAFTWQTTDIVEIVSVNEDNIEFKTKNSDYILFLK